MTNEPRTGLDWTGMALHIHTYIVGQDTAKEEMTEARLVTMQMLLEGTSREFNIITMITIDDQWGRNEAAFPLHPT